jgi:hypothetical protein
VAGLAILCLLLAWGWFVISWDTGDEEAARAGAAAPERAEPSDPSVKGGSAAGEPATSTGEAPGTSEPEEEPADREGHAAPEGTPVSEEAAGGGHDHLHAHPEGATNEPGTYDPLGTGAKPGDLTQTDEERARFAAASFVSAAYGYTGSDREEYLSGVYDWALSPDFARSQGSAEVSRYAGQVEETGTKSAARLTGFEVERTEPEGVRGWAHFETGEAYDGTELVGERLRYRQELVLLRVGAAWKVQAAGKVEEKR